jgi:KTSC domain
VERIPVSSSNIVSIGYDSETQTLEVEFINGSAYQYSGVPSDEHEAFMSAGSKGSYHHARIKQYPCSRL